MSEAFAAPHAGHAGDAPPLPRRSGVPAQVRPRHGGGRPRRRRRVRAWLHQAHVQATALLAPDPETRALVERSDRLLLGAFVAIAALLAAALGLLGVVITHRVAGPVFVMGHYLRVLADGPLSRGCGRSGGATS